MRCGKASGRLFALVAGLAAAGAAVAWASVCAALEPAAEAAGDIWPAPVPGWKAPEPGEHPRLLFRRSDLAQIRQRADSAEGKAILARLKKMLGAETLPVTDLPRQTYSMSHVAGFGLLYQVTGEKRYADAGRKAFEMAQAGVRNFDDRYSWKGPSGALRAGPSLGWYAVGYDLCYDGWDPAFRQQITKAIENYNEGANQSLEELVRGSRHNPRSNHWGMQVGGGAMALLAVMSDPGVDNARIQRLLAESEKSMVRNMTEGFGDGGYFAEGDGTGSMSSHIVFLSALQAWRNVAGKDFISPRPNAQWMALRWFFLTVPSGDRGNLRKDFPERGGYPHNIWDRKGLSGSGYFGIGFGVADPDQQAAMLWFYNNTGIRDWDQKNATPFDTVSGYPHHAVLSFVNWPIGMREKDPDDVLPHAFRDTKWGFYAWRSRWQDEDDVVISILTQRTQAYAPHGPDKTLTIRAFGQTQKWGAVNGGFTGEYRPAPDGSTVLTTGDGSCLAIDFSKASGAEAMLVMTGPAVAPGAGTVDLAGRPCDFLFLTKGQPPTPRAVGDRITVGNQTVSFDGKKLVLGK